MGGLALCGMGKRWGSWVENEYMTQKLHQLKGSE